MANNTESVSSNRIETVNKLKKIKRVGILGSGVVGRTLAIGFLKSGYEVMIGSRDPEKLKDFVTLEVDRSQLSRFSVGTFAEAAKYGDMIVISIKGDAVNEGIKLARKNNFKGKIVIDTTNAFENEKGELPRLFTKYPESLSSQIQFLLPESKVVKAFNIVPANYMINPKLKDGNPTLFIAGNNKEAKETLADIASFWGWQDIIDMGDIEQAHLIESLALFHMIFGIQNDLWTHAFKLYRE